MTNLSRRDSFSLQEGTDNPGWNNYITAHSTSINSNESSSSLLSVDSTAFCTYSSGDPQQPPCVARITRSEESDEDALYRQEQTELAESLDGQIAINTRFLLTPFTKFRLQYILAYVGIMLADGLQGTHLYVLYEGYGFSVASLYACGFVSGAFASPFTGAFVDKFGRKKAAMLYCVLEIIINYMEQYPILAGLILSRIIGGVTTNLLCSCFETWLITEHRERGFSEGKLEVILRDSGIVSNSAAILSGVMAHILASTLGPVGPFQGAVATTFVALLLVAGLWTENYGDSGMKTTSIIGYVSSAYNAIRKDSKISRVGIIQGLVEGSLQTFVFLWSPALRQLATGLPLNTIGLDKNGEPAYGLIFGAFMGSAVIGGYVAPILRKNISKVFSFRKNRRPYDNLTSGVEIENEVDATPLNFLCAICYALGSMMLLVPCIVNQNSPWAFTICLASFLVYEFLVGVYVPSEGMVRSIYMPIHSMCSTINMLRIITNVSVAIGVYSTTFVPLTFSYGVLSTMMLGASALQLSLVPKGELKIIFKSFSQSREPLVKKEKQN